MPECKHYTDAGECEVQHMRGAGDYMGERLHCRFDGGRYCHNFQLARAEAAEERVGLLADALEFVAPLYDDEQTAGDLAMRLYEASYVARRALAAHEALKEVAEDANDTPSDADAVA